MAIPGFQGVAGGDINICRFVNLSTAANKTLLEADAGERTFGISYEGAYLPPIPGASAELAAIEGRQVRVYKRGEFCQLRAGSGGWTAGAMLKSDADGKGVTASANNEWVGAESLDACAEGELGLVEVVGYFIGA